MKQTPEYFKQYRNTIRGRIISMWHSIKETAPKFDLTISMTRIEFFMWAKPELERWINNSPIEEVCLSRIDRRKGYFISNLELINKKDSNSKRLSRKNPFAPTGTAWCSHCQEYLPLVQFHKSKETKLKVKSACKIHRQTEEVRKNNEARMERRKAIVADYELMKLKDVRAKYNISKERVYQIVRRMKN